MEEWKRRKERERENKGRTAILYPVIADLLRMLRNDPHPPKERILYQN